MVWGKAALLRFKRAARDEALNPIVLDSCVHLLPGVTVDGSEIVLGAWIEHYGIETEAGHYICYRNIGNKLFKLDDAIAREVDQSNHTTSTSVTLMLYLKQ